MLLQISGFEKRTRYIDIARGIAIICIILGHLGIKSINRVVFTFHVPIFFFITGFFLKADDFSSFVKKKFRTLIIPYFATCVIIIIFAFLFEIFKHNNLINGLDVIKKWVYAALYGAGDNYFQPFYIKGIGAIWFLWATFWGACFLQISLHMKDIFRILFITILFFLGYWSRRFLWFPLSIQAGCCATMFMYFGFLFCQNLSVFKDLKIEIRIVWTIVAFIVWFYFIRDFQSFWLVHCDVGRGPADIFGCICVCYCVLLISFAIDNHFEWIAQKLAYLGKYSLIMLCVHIIELDTFPWNTLIFKFISVGLPSRYNTVYLIGLKLCFDTIATIVLSKIKPVRKLLLNKA